MYLENTMAVCDWYDPFLQSDQFSNDNFEAVVGYFGLKFLFSPFLKVLLVL